MSASGNPIKFGTMSTTGLTEAASGATRADSNLGLNARVSGLTSTMLRFLKPGQKTYIINGGESRTTLFGQSANTMNGNNTYSR